MEPTTIIRRHHAPEKPGHIDAVWLATELIAVFWKCMGADSAHASGKVLREPLDIFSRRHAILFISLSLILVDQDGLESEILWIPSELRGSEWWSVPV
jgi:hypothetical protein